MRNLRDGRDEGLPQQQSTDVFDLICKILNCKPTLLKIWRQTYCNKELLKSCQALSDAEAKIPTGATTDGEDRSSAKRRRVSGVDWELDKIFKFDMVDEDLYNHLNSKVSIDDSDDIMPTRNLKPTISEPRESKQHDRTQTFKDFLSHFDPSLFSEIDLMRTNAIRLRPEVKFSFFVMLLLVHYFTLTHYALLKIFTSIPLCQDRKSVV